MITAQQKDLQTGSFSRIKDIYPEIAENTVERIVQGGRTPRSPMRNQLAELHKEQMAILSGADDPWIWTPSAVKSELDRILVVFDTVNAEVSAATGNKLISSTEWDQWHTLYLAGHDFVTNASTWWGNNVTQARQYEQEAAKWRSLVKERGGKLQGPENLIRSKDGSWLTIGNVALIAGGLTAVIIATSLVRTKLLK